MSTWTETAGGPDGAASARRRQLLTWPRVAGAVVAVILLVGAVVFDATVLSFEPFPAPAMYQPLGDEPELITAPMYLGAFQWTFERGEEFGLAFSLENRSGPTVRVLEVPDPFPEHAYYERVEVAVSENMGRGEPCCVPEDVRAFAPFTLRPGDLRQVELRYRFRDCDLPGDGGASQSWRTQDIRYRFWGITRTATIELPVIMSVVAQGSCRVRS